MLFGLFTIYQFPSQANLICRKKCNNKHSEVNLEKVNNVPGFIVTKANHLQSVTPLKSIILSAGSLFLAIGIIHFNFAPQSDLVAFHAIKHPRCF